MSIHEPQITDSAFLSRTSAFSPIAYKPSYPEMRRWWRLPSLLGYRQLTRRIGSLESFDHLFSFIYTLRMCRLPLLQVLVLRLCTLEDGQATMNVCPCHMTKPATGEPPICPATLAQSTASSASSDLRPHSIAG